MLETHGDDNGPSPKCYLTHVRLPQHIDHRQPPTKKKPFSCILDKPFYHTVDILVPKSRAESLEKKTQPITTGHQYAKVYMKLLDLIEGDFFNTYIKQGDIIMLSAGKPGIDNTFSLHAGILRLELDRPTYERAGLPGKPIPSPGRKHSKYRYRIELNLRLPSMVRGRPLFNRLQYAFRNALTDTVTWLFQDLKDPALSTPSAPVLAFHPVLRPLHRETTQLPDSLVPADPAAIEPEDCLELYSLLLLGSPLACATSPVPDPTLARYSVAGEVQTQDLSRVRTRGFISSGVTARMLGACIDAVRSEGWAVLRTEGFDGATTVLYITGGEARVWEYDS